MLPTATKQFDRAEQRQAASNTFVVQRVNFKLLLFEIGHFYTSDPSLGRGGYLVIIVVHETYLSDAVYRLTN